MVVVIIGGLHGLQAPSGLDDRPLVATGTDQAGHPALEAQAVDNDQAGAGQLAHLGRPRLEDVGVAAGLDQALDSHAVTADLLHQVSQDAEAGHDGQEPTRRGGRYPLSEPVQPSGHQHNLTSSLYCISGDKCSLEIISTSWSIKAAKS